MVRVNHKNKEHKIYFTTHNYYKYIYEHGFTAQLACYFVQNSLIFDTHRWLMANTWQFSAQCPINRLSLLPQYMPTVFFTHVCCLPTALL